MSPPSTVEVGPFTYDISTDEATIDEIAPEAFAAIDEFALLIALEPAQDDDQMRVSLLHEVLHAVSFAVGLHQDDEDDELEDIITGLSPLLLDTLRRNPALVAYLTAP